jgi:epoxide hydrolase-like predicted phosphatase
MDDSKVAPSAHAERIRGVKAIGLDMWWTLAKIVRESDFWAEAVFKGVVEPLLLVKSELGLSNPKLNRVQKQIDNLLVYLWCTTYANGDEKVFLDKLALRLRLFDIECTVTPAAVKKLKEITAQERKDFHVFPDVPPALKALKEKGYTLALLPNQSQFNSEKYLRSKMGQHIDKVFWSYKLHLAKPDPRYFQAVLDELGIAPEEFLFIDDQPANLIAARAMGIQVVRIEREGMVPDQDLISKLGDVPVIKSLSELVEGNGRVIY